MWPSLVIVIPAKFLFVVSLQIVVAGVATLAATATATATATVTYSQPVVFLSIFRTCHFGAVVTLRCFWVRVKAKEVGFLFRVAIPDWTLASALCKN